LTQTIFDEIERSDPRQSAHAEGTFDFLNRVADPVFERERGLIEGWFAVYPSGALDDSEARRGLRSRFRSKSDIDFSSAFWELYLHEVHRLAGYLATPHPDTPTGKRIDFLMESGSDRFYLEATVVTTGGLGGSEPAGTAHVYDLINSAFNRDFFLRLELVVPGPQTPARSKVIGPIERWLETLDWDDVQERCAEGDEEYPRTTLDAGGWKITCQAFPRSESSRGDRDFPTIGIYPSRGGISTARPDILGKLQSKASRYGQLDAPYVIAVQSQGVVANEDDFERALFGEEVVRIPVGPDAPVGEATVDRDPHGLWQWGDRQRGTRVSGVLGVAGFGVNTVASTWPRMWTNPWATRPLDPSGLPWPLSTPDLEANVINTGATDVEPSTFFDLPADWPGQPFGRG
jgi:hypothetical protein